MIKYFKAVLIILLTVSFSLSAQDKNKRIVVLGSSVAAGWVTSYQEKYDMQNGYAYRLSRLLEPEGWEVVNISIPGFDTKSTIERFNDDVLPLEAGYVLIGLSMSNEGLETKDPDSVFISYRDGIREIVRLCNINNIQPVIGLCYSNNNYTEEQYGYLKKMNRLINSWDVPCVNLLGVLDDGYGHFPEGYTFDPNHPDDRGHEEMFYAFVPDMFEAMHEGKNQMYNLNAMPQDTLHFDSEDIFLNLGKKARFSEVSYIPSDVMHSFTLAFQIKNMKQGKITEIISVEGLNEIRISKNGHLHYTSPYGEIMSREVIDENTTIWVMLTHQYLTAETKLYLNNQLQGVLREQLEPLCFSFGNGKRYSGYRDLFLFRGALNQEETNMIYHGKKFHASMELFCPLIENENEMIAGQELLNLALTNQSAFVDDNNKDVKINALLSEVREAQYQRENELKVAHRTAIELDPSILDQYEGSYEIEPGDAMIVLKETDKLYLDDHGRKAELLPEGNDQFFIKYPGDILVIFKRDDSGNITGLILSINGRELAAEKE